MAVAWAVHVADCLPFSNTLWEAQLDMLFFFQEMCDDVSSEHVAKQLRALPAYVAVYLTFSSRLPVLNQRHGVGAYGRSPRALIPSTNLRPAVQPDLGTVSAMQNIKRSRRIRRQANQPNIKSTPQFPPAQSRSFLGRQPQREAIPIPIPLLDLRSFDFS